MAGKSAKLVGIILFCLLLCFSLCLLFTRYYMSPNQYADAAFQMPGSTWKSTNPDMWFTVNEDGTNEGELNYSGKTIKICNGYRGGILNILVTDAGGEPELAKIMQEQGGTLIATIIHSCSKTKLVLDVYSSNLPDITVKQIIFTKSS